MPLANILNYLTESFVNFLYLNLNKQNTRESYWKQILTLNHIWKRKLQINSFI